MTIQSPDKKMIKVLSGQVMETPPVWLMRQAGRYLPEYRATRAQAGDFLSLCYNPELACEVTMQPLRRYAFDAAILFSDILVIPQALGQTLTFTAGEGPQLPPIRNNADLNKLSLDRLDDTLAPIYQTLKNLRKAFIAENCDETTLIGFAGSPWTIACYMVEGQGSRDFAAPKIFLHNDESSFNKLIDLITDATIHYLSEQIKAGAEVIQLFDSWAGSADEDVFNRYVIKPTAKIVNALKTSYSHVKIIGFPRGAGFMYQDYIEKTKVDAVGLDTNVTLAHALTLQKIVPIQGYLDPILLLSGGTALDKRVRMMLENLKEGPYIFNLGHGIIKETDPANVTQLINIIRNT
jgi:uroporphyrinogen decarboxylase